MTILALDQSTRITGWAVEVDGHVEYGIIKTPAKLTGNDAMAFQVAGIMILLSDYTPRAVALEETHFRRNIKTAIMLSRFRGRIEQKILDRNLMLIDVSSQEVQKRIGLAAFAKKTVKKTRSRFWATCEVKGEQFAMQNDPSEWVPEDAADAVCILRIAQKKATPQP